MPQGRNKPRKALKVESQYCAWCGGQKRFPTARYCSGKCAEMGANPDAPWTVEEVWHRARAVRLAARAAEERRLSEAEQLELERQFEALHPDELEARLLRETA